MPSDNQLGAPTEGLGQNVTFAFNSNAGAPQLEAGDPGRIRGGIVDGGTVNPGGTQTIGVAPTPASATLAVLGKVADSTLQQNLKQRQVEAYISGMQRAMQGEAVTDIAHSQPWYSKIFGDSDVVEGARAYTGNTVAQTQVAAMQDAMPDLRKMDGPTAQKYFTDSVMKSLTGDPATDLSIQQSMVRALPSVMRQQAKEHYGWKQEQATAAENASFKSGAATLQGLGESLSSGITTPEEFAQAQQQFIRSQFPAAGRDEKNWQDAQMDRLVNAARQGQFHVLNAAQKPADGKDGPSLLDALKADQQSTVLRAIEMGEREARQRYLPSVYKERSDIELRAMHPPEGTTPDQLADAALAMNKTYQDKTGASTGIWTPEEVTAIRKGAGAAIYTLREQNEARLQAATEKYKTGEQKKLADEAKTSAILDSFAAGGLYQTASTPGYANDLIDYTVQQRYRAMNPDEKAQALVNNRGYVVKPISTERENAVEASLAAGPDALTGATQQAYTDWKMLYDKDKSVASAYYPKTGPKLEYFQRLVDSGLTPTQAYKPAFVDPIKKPEVNEKILKETIKAVQSSENGLFHADLDPMAERFLAQRASDSAAVYLGVLGDPKAAATRAFQVLKQSGNVEILGSYAWDAPRDHSQGMLPYLTKTYGGQALRAGGQVAMPYDDVGSTFNAALRAFMEGTRVTDEKGNTSKTAGITRGESPANVMLTPLNRAPGQQPALAVSILDKRGAMYTGIIQGDDIFTLAAQHKKSEINAATAPTQPYVTPGNTDADIIRPNLVGAPQ